MTTDIWAPAQQRKSRKLLGSQPVFLSSPKDMLIDFILFLKNISFIFRERGKEGQREGEKHQCGVASHVPPTGNLARNSGMCPDWESNWRPFALQSGAQSIEPHQPGLAY